MTGDIGAPMVRAVGVRKSFGRHQVLKGIDLEVAAGEVVALLGPSGSGKSTFLRCINHLETIDGGEIAVAGNLVGYRRQNGKKYELHPRDIATARRDVGMVFQRFNLFNHLTAHENITLAPVLAKGQPRDAAAERARRLLDDVGLGDYGNHYPSQLSGGQQQRVAIARALMNSPPVILADEPTGNLDTRSSVEIMGLFKQLNSDGITIVMVTHEEDIAACARRRILMRDGQVVT